MRALLVLLVVASSSSLVLAPLSRRDGTIPRQHRSRLMAVASAGVASRGPLPPDITPITLGVFSQMLGEGIAMSSLALYLTRLGAEPLMVGVAISCFSVTQMTFAPIMVRLSSKVGRLLMLRICLAGAAASSLLIALSGNVFGVVAGRTLAGIFAASIPVAQSGVTDILPKEQAALGLSRVSAAAQLGLVVGPAASALFQAAFAAMGLPSEHCLSAVFVLTAAVALGVMIQIAILDGRRQEVASVARVPPESSVTEKQRQVDDDQVVRDVQAASDDRTTSDEEPGAVRLAQPMLRTITIIIGWTAVLSNSIYGLFAPRFMGFGQPQLSATYSAAAALMIGVQLVFPRLVARIGEHRACMLGILAAGAGIGGQALLRVQPIHSLLYMTNRVGAAVADTATAALVARASVGSETRSHNLALLTSTRAAARVLSPLVSSKMFELSCRGSVAPGALPFVTAACFAMAVAPLPMLLLRAERKNV